MVYTYRTYGLGIHSTLSLPEMSAVAAPNDIFIHAQDLPAPPLPKHANSHTWRQDQDIYLHWADLGTFRVRAGQDIAFNPVPGVSAARLRPPILGICMAVALHQRGLLVLHASAIALPTGAIAFLGDKGWGKSTMNAALYRRGHKFVTDDILAIDSASSKPQIYPAFAQMKLWPSAVAALGKNPQKLPKLLPHLQKRQRLLKKNIAQKAVPLSAIYLLDKGPSIHIAPLPAHELLGHLFRHSYSGRCGKALLHRGETDHFLQCMALAQQVPIYRLQRPVDLSLLDAIAAAVEAHAAAISDAVRPDSVRSDPVRPNSVRPGSAH